MAWDNRKKIHFAGGTSTAISKSEVVQGSRQPVFISDKNYLTVGPLKSGLVASDESADDNRDVHSVAPIKSRTVEGWLSDTETDDSFTLTGETKNHYILTGRNGAVYLKTTPDFHLIREVKTNGELDTTDIKVLSLLNDGNKNYISINDDLYLKSKNIRTTNLQDINGNNEIQLAADGITLLKSTSTSQLFKSTGSTELSGTLALNATTTLNSKLTIGTNGSIETATFRLHPNSTNDDSADIYANKGKVDSIYVTNLTVAENGSVSVFNGGNGALKVGADKIELTKPLTSNSTVNISGDTTLNKLYVNEIHLKV